MTPRVVILGAGVAGLTTALALARAGAPVDVLERDKAPAPFGRRTAASWVRDGTPQAQHAHVFGPECHRVLASEMPDVLSLLLAAGARESSLPGPGPGTALAVRRPLFDWVLRRVAEREPGVRVHCGTAATGLRTDGSRLTGVVVRDGVLSADVAVDATGSRGQVPGWLADLGYSCAHPPPAGPTSFTTYYSRCYALRWPGEPGALNLGVAAGGALDGYDCRAVPGDNGTVTVTFGIPAASVAELAALRMPGGFQAAVEQVPVVADWVDPGAADPLTGVAVLTEWPSVTAPGLSSIATLPGLVAVGDARGVPDPAADHGVAVAMAHALACAGAILAGGPHPAADLEQRVHAAPTTCPVEAGLPTPRPALLNGPSAHELARIAESVGMAAPVGVSAG
ncbi:MAG: FAD-dependent oxidoreductase [Pseudonocardia sp.]